MLKTSMDKPTLTDIRPLKGYTRQCEIDFVVTGRKQSLFQCDLTDHVADISKKLRGRRVLIVGGGGSIGSAITRLLLDYRPQSIHVVDQNENYLAELVRNVRGRPQGLLDVDFRTLPLDYGSPIMERFLRDAQWAYHIVLNCAALKHVRSEKDTYSILQMLDTNLVKHAKFKRWLLECGHGSIYFAVSTDKAANPTSLMGASKRLMEDLVFGLFSERAASTTSARFANVSFSNGSLLDGFLRRLAARQPLAAPRNTRRYFISHTEASELCLIAALLAPDKHIVFPKLDPAKELQTLESIAVKILEHFGLVPLFYEDEERARHEVDAVYRLGRWPVLLTPLDTSGEKSFEEFVGAGETPVEIGMNTVSGLRHVPSRALKCELFDRIAVLVNDPLLPASKNSIVNDISQVLAEFSHVDTGRSLDERF